LRRILRSALRFFPFIAGKEEVKSVSNRLGKRENNRIWVLSPRANKTYETHVGLGRNISLAYHMGMVGFKNFFTIWSKLKTLFPIGMGIHSSYFLGYFIIYNGQCNHSVGMTTQKRISFFD